VRVKGLDSSEEEMRELMEKADETPEAEPETVETPEEPETPSEGIDPAELRRTLTVAEATSLL
jgi:hypothetical protein